MNCSKASSHPGRFCFRSCCDPPSWACALATADVLQTRLSVMMCASCFLGLLLKLILYFHAYLAYLVMAVAPGDN